MGTNGQATKNAQLMGKIEVEYVTTSATLRGLAEKYGVSFQAVRNASHFQCWVQLRNAYRKQVRDGAMELSLQRDIKDFQLIVSNSVKLLQQIEAVVNDPYGLKRYIGVETEKSGGEMSTKMVERTFERVDMSQLKQLVDAQKVIMDGLYKLYSVPTQAEAESQRLAAERLELERDKFEAEREKEGGEDITIRLEVPEEYTV